MAARIIQGNVFDVLQGGAIPAGSVDEVLRELTSRYPDLRQQLFSDDGKLRRFVNLYVNDEDIRYLQNENTPVGPNDTLSIIPSVAGGCLN